MQEALSLVASLTLCVGASLLASAYIWWRFAFVIDDEAGIRVLRGVSSNSRPGWLVTTTLTGLGVVIAWFVAFVIPAYLSESLADAPLMVAFGLVAGSTGWLFWIDQSIHRLPNRIVVPLTAVVLLLFLGSLVMGVVATPAEADLGFAGYGTWALRGLIGGLALLIVFGLINLLGAAIKRTTMGMGDVKLSVIVGLLSACALAVGPVIAFVVMCISALIGIAYGALAQGKSLKDPVAFGPHMLIATWTAVIVSPVLL